MFAKNLKTSFIFKISIIGLFCNCAYFSSHGTAYLNAKKAYSVGNYEKAINNCIISLRYNDTYKPSIELLQNIFPLGIDFHNKNIERLKISRDYYKWDSIILELEILLKLIDDIESLNSNIKNKILKISNIRDYFIELEEAKENAAKAHYNYGLSKMETGTKHDYKVAAISFKNALEFVQNYKDSQELYENCRKSASIKLGIFPFENKTGKKKYSSISQNISNNILSKFFNDDNLMEFIDIINRDKIDLIIKEQKLSHSGLVDNSQKIKLGEIDGINMMVIGEINQIIVNNPKKISEKQNLSKKVIKNTTTYTDSKGKIKKKYTYKTIRGTITHHKQESSAKVNGTYKILDTETAQVISGGNVEGIYSYSYDWATFNGNRNVLDYRWEKKLNKKSKIHPSKDKLVDAAFEKITENFYNAIKSSIQ